MQLRIAKRSCLEVHQNHVTAITEYQSNVAIDFDLDWSCASIFELLSRLGYPMLHSATSFAIIEGNLMRCDCPYVRGSICVPPCQHRHLRSLARVVTSAKKFASGAAIIVVRQVASPRAIIGSFTSYLFEV